MSCQSSKLLLRLAVPEDGPGIISVLEDIDFEGNISLLYTRRPDAYKSLLSEGEEVVILICQDLENFAIVGVGACAIRHVFLNGQTEKVGYLTGLRLKKAYRNTFQLLPRAYDFLYSNLKDRGIKYFFTTILEDNPYAQRLLEKRRKIMPYYEPLGLYEVYAMKRKATHHRQGNFNFKRAGVSDGPKILEFLHRQGKAMQFFPEINIDNFPGLSWEDFYFLSNSEGDIMAAGAAWVQTSYKQYIVHGYGGVLKYLYPFSFLLPLFGYPALPKTGSMLNFFTLSFWAVQDNDPFIFNAFLENIAGALEYYPFFLIGIHQANPLRQELIKVRHIRYTSKLYLVNWEKQGYLREGLNGELVPYLECGTL